MKDKNTTILLNFIGGELHKTAVVWTDNHMTREENKCNKNKKQYEKEEKSHLDNVLK